jgi:DNA-binding CsgD family transcriptional regulator
MGLDRFAPTTLDSVAMTMSNHERALVAGLASGAKSTKHARNKQVLALSAQGYSQTEIAARFGLSRQRIHRIISRYGDKGGQAA